MPHEPLIVACVRTGTKYPYEWVRRLKSMVGRHLPVPYRFYCLTDQPERSLGISYIDISRVGLPGWWGKMLLFEEAWRDRSPIIYFDLDTVIVGDLTPLTRVPHEFAILRSPVKAYNPAWPCGYNSSVMIIGAGRCGFVWKQFDEDREQYMEKCKRGGDQLAIEMIYPYAPLLNNLMPKPFFLNYRYLTQDRPHGVSVVNFGGANKPDNCITEWVQREWR